MQHCQGNSSWRQIGYTRRGHSYHRYLQLTFFWTFAHSRAKGESPAFFPKELIILPAKQGKGKTPRVKNLENNAKGDDHAPWPLQSGSRALYGSQRTIYLLLTKTQKKKKKMPKGNYTKPTTFWSALTPPSVLPFNSFYFHLLEQVISF